MTDDTKRSRADTKEPQATPPAPPADKPPEQPPEDPIESQQVTYLPDPEDQPQTKFAGHTFSANTPKVVELPKSVVERLRGNRFFKVGAFDPKTDTVKAQPILVPKTAEEYQVHAVKWFKDVQSLHEFDERWTQEEALRQACEVGAEELDYLGHLARARRGELKKKLQP